MAKSPLISGNLVPTSGEKAETTRRISAFVQSAIESLGTLAKAAEVAEVSTDQMARWRDGLAMPNFLGLGRLAVRVNYPMEALITGDEDRRPPVAQGIVAYQEEEDLREFTLVPRVDVSASAGHGLTALAEEITERLAFKTDWLREMGLSPTHIGLVTAKGDSQEPTIPNGSLMLVDLSPNQQIRSGHFYVIVLDGDLLVKRLNRLVDGTIELISDNQAYRTESVSAQFLDKLTIPGRVVWIGHSI